MKKTKGKNRRERRRNSRKIAKREHREYMNKIQAEIDEIKRDREKLERSELTLRKANVEAERIARERIEENDRIAREKKEKDHQEFQEPL